EVTPPQRVSKSPVKIYHAGQVVQSWLVKPLPVEIPAHHWPPSSQRPVMSPIPSPLKSPTLTSTQVATVLHVAHLVVVNDEPVEMAVHNWPASLYRPVISALPSPLKSPTFHIHPGGRGGPR